MLKPRMGLALALGILPLVLPATSCFRENYEQLLRSANACGARQDYDCAIRAATRAITADPARPEAYYALGLANLATGSERSAADQFSRAIGFNPHFHDARLSLAEMMATSADRRVLEEARKHAQTVLAESPKNRRAVHLLARIALELDEAAECERLLRSALGMNPADLEAAVSLAKLLLATGKADEAEAVMRAAADSPGAAQESPIALVEFYAALGRSDRARETIGRMTADGKNDPRALLASAQLLTDEQPAEKDRIYAQLAASGRRDLRTLHAIYLLDGGKLDPAIAELDQLQHRYPEDRTVRTMLVDAWMDAGRLQQAESFLTNLLSRTPDDIDAMLQRSALSIRAGRAGEAQPALNRVLQLRPDCAMAFYLMAKTMLERRQFKSYRQQLDEAVIRDGFLFPARIDLTLELARARAERAALAAMDATPLPQASSAQYHIYAGWAALAAGEMERAGAEVRWLVRLGSSSPEAALVAAVYAMSRHKFDAALTAASMAAEAKPGDTRTLAVLVRAASLAGGESDVRRVLAGLAERHASIPQPLEVLGDFELARGRIEEASKFYQAASRRGPQAIAARLQLARLALSRKDYADAMSRIAEARRTEPANLTAMLLGAAAANATGDFSKAAEDYRAILEAEPENWVAANNLASVLSEHLKRPDEALKYAETAAELKPFDAEIEDTLGWVYFRKGLFDLAVMKLRSAVGTKGTARQRYHLAMAFCRVGDFKTALEEYHRATRMDSTSPEAQEALHLLAAAQVIRER